MFGPWRSVGSSPRSVWWADARARALYPPWLGVARTDLLPPRSHFPTSRGIHLALWGVSAWRVHQRYPYCVDRKDRKDLIEALTDTNYGFIIYTQSQDDRYM